MREKLVLRGDCGVGLEGRCRGHDDHDLFRRSSAVGLEAREDRSREGSSGVGVRSQLIVSFKAMT